MSKNKNKQYDHTSDDSFWENFEVTYGDESGYRYKKQINNNNTRYNEYDDRYEDDYEDEYDDRYEDDYEDEYDDRYEDDYEDEYDDRYEDDYEDEYDDRYAPQPRSRRKPQRPMRKKRRPVTTPLEKTATKSARFLQKLTSFVLNMATPLLILAVMTVIAIGFWRSHYPFGNIDTAVDERNLTLATYFVLPAFLLFFEFISFFWSMTKARVDYHGRIRKLDIGRGLGSFITIYVCCILSIRLSTFVPETFSILKGLKGSMEVYGSLFGALSPFCIAGIVVCLIRKFKL